MVYFFRIDCFSIGKENIDMKRFFTVKNLCLSGIIAALYAGLTVLLQALSFGPVQIRVAEAMTLLPYLFPAAVPGLAIGCFIANLLGSPFMLDWIFGTLATLLAALLSRRMPNRYLAALPPVLCNAGIVGAEIAWFAVLDGGAFWPAYAVNALSVGFGELVACYVLGLVLLDGLPRISFFRGFIPDRRLSGRA
jgi:uncharacterized membrane protein